MPERINNAKIVSFDIFDTLVTRPLFSPFDVFDRVAYVFFKRHKINLPNFRKIRIHAEESIRAELFKEKGYQDVTLAEIYCEVQRLYSLPSEMVEVLSELEQEVEFSLIRIRPAGKILYKSASSAFKDIILVSDMYLSREYISRLLKKTDYRGFIELYLSSELRMRKREGDLFRHVLSEVAVNPQEMLHIGDNIFGDFEVPNGFGINTLRIARAAENFEKQSENWQDIVSLAKKSRTFSQSLTLGLIAERYFDDPGLLQAKTDFGGDPNVLGYCALGPLVGGFCSWIHRNSVADQIDTLLFLSRDGKVAKDFFDILYRGVVKTHYFHLSRRAIRVALIKTEADLLSICKQAVYNTTIGAYLNSRFGLEKTDINLELLKLHGCSDIEFKIGAKFSKEALAGIVLGHKEEIFARATFEREALLAYVDSLGIRNKRVAIVDIGYAGTMQDGLSSILGQHLTGYYLATFSTISASLAAIDAKGYLKSESHPDDSSGGICTHRFIYETLFCDSSPSFVCYEKNHRGGDIGKKFNISHDDSVRQKLVLQIHAGTLAFAHDLKDALPNDIEDFTLAPDFASRILDKYLLRPHPVDAAMLEGVVFEDSAGPNTVRYIVPPKTLVKDSAAFDSAIWSEGAKAARRGFLYSMKSTATAHTKANKSFARVVNSRPLARKLEAALIKRFSSKKIYTKYLRSRDQYFLDTKHTLLAFYYKKFG